MALQICDAPSGWTDEEGKDRHAAVLAHLGSEYFFDRAAPHRRTKAPDFGLGPLDPLPALQVFTADGEHVTAIPSEDATTSSYDA
jgi:hypothetical protein